MQIQIPFPLAAPLLFLSYIAFCDMLVVQPRSEYLLESYLD